MEHEADNEVAKEALALGIAGRRDALPTARADRLALWGEGPWIDEHDEVRFEAFGLPCLMRRNGRMGAWCGYVAVPPGHPMHGKSYDEGDEHLSAHGGLTFAGGCHGPICHIPKPGEPDDVWWFGFDCAHAGDLVPGLEFTRKLYAPSSAARREALQALYADTRDVYRDEPHVHDEVAALAAQLAYIGRRRTVVSRLSERATKFIGKYMRRRS